MRAWFAGGFVALVACGDGERSAEWRHDAEVARGPFRVFSESEACTCDVGPTGMWEITCGPEPVDRTRFYVQFPFPSARNVREAHPIAWTWRTTGYEHRFDGGYGRYVRLPDVVLPESSGVDITYAPIWFDEGYFPAHEACDNVGCHAEDEGDLRGGWVYCRVPVEEVPQ